jgi:hypothetical protein
MRRWLQKILPVVLAALAIQMLAQMEACWAAALAVSDPLASSPICHSSVNSAPAGSDQGDNPGHDDGCAMCCVLNASASGAPPLVTLATPLRREVEAVLMVYDGPDLSAGRVGSNSLARAPPQAI